MAMLISLASAAISLFALQDVRNSKRETELLEASKVSWTPLWDPSSNTPSGVMVENRSMNTVFDVWLNIEKPEENGKDGDNLQRFEFKKISPCTRDSFVFGEELGRKVRFNESIELFFKDPLGRIWRVDPAGYPNKWPAETVAKGEGVDLVAAWKLSRTTNPAENCA